MNGRRAWFALLLAVPWSGGTCGPAWGQGEFQVPALGDTLYGAAWRAEALGRRAQGHLCWVQGGRGELRVEILQEGDTPAPTVSALPGVIPPALLAQIGQGWTVVLGPDDRGTWNPWGREWSPADPSLAPLVRFGLRQLARAEGVFSGAAPRRVRQAVRPSLHFDANAVTGEPSAFRREMVHRGLGQGGTGEILTLDRRPGLAVLTSSRRSGKVEIRLPLQRCGIRPPIPEVFTPLWPLEALLEISPADPGTPGRDGR